MLATARTCVVMLLLVGFVALFGAGAGEVMAHDFEPAATARSVGPNDECPEHGPAHSAVYGGHCCLSAPANLAAMEALPPVIGHPVDIVGWGADDGVGGGPVFGIFRPPRHA